MSTPILPDLTGFTEHYGIRLAIVGDEGDWTVGLGHHDTRRFLAAVNRMTRIDLCYSLGLETGWDYSEAAERVYQASCVLIEWCNDHGASDPDCSECREIAAATWWLNWDIADGSPGAFPVTVMGR